MKRFRQIACSIIFLLVCVFIFPYLSQAVTPKVVRVGVFESQGFYGKDESDNPTGYGYAYLQEIAKNNAYTYEYRYGTWPECLEMLRNGEIDLLDAAPKTAGLEHEFLFSEYPTGRTYSTLSVASDNTDIALNDYQAFNGMHIGMLAGAQQNTSLVDYAATHGFHFYSYFYDSMSELEQALADGSVDAILATNLRDLRDERIVARFAPQPFYLIAEKDHSGLMQEINQALERIQISNPDFSSSLERQYFDNNSSTAILTRAEIDYVQASAPITVVYDSFWPPFESYDSANDVPTGLNVDLFHQIADDSGLRFEFLDGYNYESALDMVCRAQADMLLSYDTNPQRAHEIGITLSDTYLQTPITIIGKSYDIAPDSVFAISEMTPLIHAYIKDRFPQSTILLYPDISKCYQAVDEGDADFTAENVYAATEAIKTGAYGDLKIVSTTTLKDNFSFAFRGDIDPMLIGIFNKYIAAFPNEEKDALLMTYSAKVASDEGLAAFLKKYSVEVMIVLLVLLCSVIGTLTVLAIVQKRNRRMLESIAYTDSLTGLPNLNALRKAMDVHFKKPNHVPCVMLHIDISRFNLINEIYGLAEGNAVLCAVRDALLQSIPAQQGLVARSHDDHFIILYYYTDSPDDLDKVYWRKMSELQKSLAQSCLHVLHFCSGRYLVPHDETDVNAILERVNYAHNVAKQRGLLNKPYDYDDAIRQQALRHRQIESKMDRALLDEQFVVYLQPKYCLQTEQMVGAEALVRWNNFDENGMLTPGEFVPLFEKNGFIVKLDYYMFRQVCGILDSWRRQGLPLIPISSNFSRLHLQNDHLIQDLCTIVDAYALPHKFLEVELTESAVSENETLLASMILELHQAGFSLAMDDFGIGYSTLALLKNYAIDTVKLDRMFFKEDDDPKRAHTVLENVVRMTKELGIHTLAEGVETRENIEFLRTIGCETVQGYYYSKPLPLDKFEQLLRKANGKQPD